MPAFAAKPLWKTTTASDLLEGGQPALELHVDVHGAGDGADRAGADAERAGRLQRLFAQLRMRRQAEVVVRREIDDLAVIERGLVALFAIENPEMAVQALLFERVEFAGQVGERVGAHSGVGP